MFPSKGHGVLPRVIGRVATPNTSGNPPFTVDDFYTQYPQFFTLDKNDNPVSKIPLVILQAYIDLAHASITYSVYREYWIICMGLFIAHFATLYLQTMDDPLAGDTAGLVSSKSVDGVSVSYDNSAITADMDGFGEFKATTFGLQLITFAQIVGIGGLYVR